mgnify:CR=1 FL=1
MNRQQLTLPPVAYGTWQLDDAAAQRCVASAIDDGYRLIDTAMRYHNEYGVGRGIKDSSIPREELMVATKLRGGDQGRDQARRAFFASLRNLGTEYVDIYFIHWPLPRLGLYLESYETMLELQADGYIRHVAVCNFPNRHLQAIKQEFDQYPVINQFELHPGYPQHEWVEFCQANGIAVQGWGVIGRGRGLLDDPTVQQMAADKGCTPAQLCIAWAATRGICSIAKSATPERWRANLAAAEIRLSDEELATLDAVDFPRTSKDPEVDEEY